MEAQRARAQSCSFGLMTFGQINSPDFAKRDESGRRVNDIIESNYYYSPRPTKIVRQMISVRMAAGGGGWNEVGGAGANESLGVCALFFRVALLSAVPR